MGTPIRPEPQSLSELMGQREKGNPIPDSLRIASDATANTPAPRAARVLRVQSKTAWPTDFIDRNLEVLEVEVDKPEFNAERFWRESPAIAAWMAAEPTRVAAARGRDMERLGRVEGYLKAIGTEFERNTITTQLVEPGLAAMFGRATPEQEAEITRLRGKQQALPDVLGTRGFVSGIPIAAIGQLPVTLSLYKGAGVGAVVGGATGAAGGAVRGAVTTGTPQGAAVGALAMGVRGAFLGSRVGVALEGIKMEATNAFLDYREMEGVSRETAAAGALIAGTISGALELLPFENAAKAIPGLRRLGKDGIREMLMAPNTRRLLQRYGGQVLSQMGAEGFTEGLQELVQIAGGVLTERYAEGTLNLLSTETILREIFSAENVSRIGSAARTGAQSGGGLGVATGGVATAMDAPAVRRAELNAQRMQQAAEAIHGNDREEAVTLAKDAPEAMREAVASVGAEGVYFDISEFTGYWQSQRTPDGEAANPREVAIALGVTPQEYDAALESGAPINIPTDRLLVDAMASPVHKQWFVDNLRVTPNELSKAEAMAQRETASQPMAEAAMVEDAPTREVEAETGIADLRDRLTAELRGAKVGTEELQASVALWTEAAKTAIRRNPDLPVEEVLRRFERVQVVARPVAAFPDGKAVSQYAVTGETMDRGDGTLVPVLKTTRQARATAARLETIAAEKGAKMTPKQREQVEAARLALQDAEAVNKTLTPVDFAALKGPVDVQGMTPEQQANVAVEANLESLQQAAFHGTPYTFDKFDLSKIGTGEGAQAFGWGLYFAENEQVAALPATIDVDGVPRPTTNSNGQPIHPTERGVKNFWRWATADGKQPVVDGNGNPLVLYHGTTGDFSEFDLSRANPDSDWGRGIYATSESEDVSVNYAGEGPDLTQRIQLMAERIASDTDREYDDPDVLAEARERLSVENLGAVVPVYGRMKNPVVIGGADETRLTFEMVQDEDGEYTGDENGTLVDFIVALRNAASQYEEGDVESFVDALWAQASDGDITAQEVYDISRETEAFNYFTDENGDLVSHEILRQAFEGAGFGGVIDNTVYDKFGGGRKIGKAMQGVEYGTTHYILFDNTDVKSALGNDGTFGPTANILAQESAEGPRGAFVARSGRTGSGARIDGPRLVALFAERNQTTFLHETAHAFLDIWASLADDPRTNPEFTKLVTDLKGELGADPTATLTEAQEEAFAGMFLDYTKTGKAPSVALRQAFASFAAFIAKLWSFVKGEIVPANDNVRELLDRLLATDEAIAEAQGEFMAPLFPEDAQVNAAFVKARTEAEEVTRTEAMRAVVRAEAEWWKKASKEVAEEVRERVNQDPAYIARQILTTGQMPDGTPMTGSPLLAKLNREQVVAILGKDDTKALPRGKTGAVYNTSGEGLDLNVAAEALGYPNGPALLQALQQTIPIDEQVARVTQATMTERYGDPVNEVSAVAVQAIHNVSLDRMRQLEMEAILRDHPEAFREAMVKAASRPVNVRELKAWAQEQLAGRTLRTIRPAEYLSAERKAGKEAIRAVSRGEWAKAIQAKAKQRAASALYAESVAAKDAVTKFQDVVSKVFGDDERIAKSRNLDIVMAARQFLAQQGIGKREQDTQFYLAQLAEYDPETAATLEGVVADFAVPPRDDFKSLTYAEFESVRDAVVELWDAAKQTETLTIAGRKIRKAEAVADLKAVLAEQKDSAVEGAGIQRVADWRDKANRAVLTGKASLRRVESWVDWMDGGDINGPFRRYIFATLREKTAEKSVANTADLTAYDALLDGIRPSLNPADIPAPELGPRWVFRGKAHLVATLLHTGNPSNLAMLLGGRGWTMDGWMAFRDRMVAEGKLTPADFDFVQNVWNLFEAKKPEAQKVHRRMFGRYFDEITREAFTIQFPDGTERTYAGGYTPASKDPDASTLADQRAADNMLEEAYGMKFPTVQKGFTIGRVPNFEPLLLSMDIVPKHLDAVNKFIYLAEPVREVGRLLRDKELRAEMDRVNPAIVNELLMPWLQRTSTQVVQTPSASKAMSKYVDPIAKYLRTTAGASMMFLNVANTLEQATGLSVAAVRVKPRFLSLAQVAVLKDGNAVTDIMERDNPFMQERTSTMVMEVRRRIDNITTDPNIFQKAQSFAEEHAYVLQSAAQNHVDRIVWYGSYLESVDAGLTIDEAKAKANADVRLTQGSFDAVDVSRIETGNPWWRLFAMFASYFNMLANLNATEMQKAVDTMGLKKSMPRLFAVYALGFAVPMLASNLIRRGMMGRAAFNDVEGDDEWGYLDDFMAWFFGNQIRGASAMVPVVGSTVNYGVNLFDNKVFNDQLSLSPAISFVESAGRGVKANYDMFTGEDFQRRDIRDMLSLFSLASRVPVTGFARPLTYLYDVNEGRANPSGPIDFTRGLLSGQPGSR